MHLLSQSRKKTLQLIFILFFSFSLRIYKLGSIPYGINFPEAENIIFCKRILYYLLNSPVAFETKLFAIRLFTAIPSSFVPLMAYFLWLKLSKENNHLIGFILALTIAFSPWHIYLSRRFLILPVLFAIILAIILIFAKRIMKLKSVWLYVIAALLGIITIFFDMFIVPDGKVSIKPIWTESSGFFDFVFIWLSNISSYFNLSRLGFEDEIYILGLKSNSPLLASTIPFIIGGFLVLIKNFNKYRIVIFSTLIYTSILSFFYPPFNLSLALGLIPVYALLTALGLQTFIYLFSNKIVRFVIVILLIGVFSFNIFRSLFVLRYYQPIFDKLEQKENHFSSSFLTKIKLDK